MRPVAWLLAVLAALTAAAPAPATAVPGPVSLTAGWRYRPDPGDAGLRAGWAAGGAAGPGSVAVTLPHVFDARPAPELFAGSVGWYTLRFSPPPPGAGETWWADFQQVRRVASVYLDGRLVGTHTDPYTPFAVPLTGLSAGPHTLVVRADNRKGADPREGWWNWGGITRPVSLVARGAVTLDSPALLTDMRCDTAGSCSHPSVTLDAWATNRTTRARPVTVAVAMTPPGPGPATTWRVNAGTVAPGHTVRVRGTRPVAGSPRLWAPGHPDLYAATITTTVGGREVQVDRQAVGLRQVGVHDGLLYLDGRRIDLRGASIEEDVPGRGPALTGADMDRIVAQLRAAHADATRAQYLLSPALLDRLDRAGILVWSQAPIYHRDAQLVSGAERAGALSTVRDTVLAARLHPSVMTHSVANELTPVPDAVPGTRAFLDAAASLVADLDPSVPSSLDLLSYPGYPRQRTYTRFPLLGVNNYFGWYPGTRAHSTADLAGLAPYLERLHARYPGQALVMTEFGAEATIGGPATEKQTYAFQRAYLAHTLSVVGAEPFMSGALYWTLREFAVKPHWDGGAHRHDLPRDSIHHKGLIAYDGTPKPAFADAARLFASVGLYPPFSPVAARPGGWPDGVTALVMLALLSAIGALLALALWGYAGVRRLGTEPPAPPAPPAPRRRARRPRPHTYA